MKIQEGNCQKPKLSQPLQKMYKFLMGEKIKSFEFEQNLYKNQKSKKFITISKHNKKMQECQEQDNMIKEEYDSLVVQREEEMQRNSLLYKNAEIWNEANYQPTKTSQSNRHGFNIYADKLLIHLVIEEEFDFTKISYIMTYTFKYENKLYSEQACRERWFQLHRDREIQSLRKIQQSLDKKRQISNKKDKEQEEINKKSIALQSQTQKAKIEKNSHHGYNIFKDSIRKIDDVERYKELQNQMRSALDKAAQSIELEKPMLYTPYYDRLQKFQVLEEELTVEKMQQLMSHPIEMELMERQLKVLDLNERNFESKVKKDVEKKVKQEKIKNEEEFQIEDNWDEYESD